MLLLSYIIGQVEYTYVACCYCAAAAVVYFSLMLPVYFILRVYSGVSRTFRTPSEYVLRVLFLQFSVSTPVAPPPKVICSKFHSLNDFCNDGSIRSISYVYNLEILRVKHVLAVSHKT